ncbi:MAG: PAS domain S-box protein [Terriglobia bacterium]
MPSETTRWKLEKSHNSRKDRAQPIARSQAALLDCALDCIVMADHTGRILEFNRAAEKTFGYRREEIVGKNLADTIVPPAHREAHRQGMARYLATGESRVIDQRIEITAMRATGDEFPVELTIAHCFGRTSALRGIPPRYQRPEGG